MRDSGEMIRLLRKDCGRIPWISWQQYLLLGDARVKRAMPHAYTEAPLVDQPAIGLFAQLGWQVELATTGESAHPAARL